MSSVVSVTKRDITQGKPDDTDACPVARAIKRLVKKGVTVHVIGDDGVEFETKDKLVARKMPAKATRFVRRFDVGDAVEPFEFKLNIPDAFLKA